jgi:hypothetical protein
MSKRRIESGRAAKAVAPKDSQVQKKVPKRFIKPTGEDAVPGRYEAGIKNDKFALLFGQTVATWVHVEDQMIQVLQDLLGSRSAPARQIFHSVVSNKARHARFDRRHLPGVPARLRPARAARNRSDSTVEQSEKPASCLLGIHGRERRSFRWIEPLTWHLHRDHPPPARPPSSATATPRPR